MRIALLLLPFILSSCFSMGVIGSAREGFDKSPELRGGPAGKGYLLKREKNRDVYRCKGLLTGDASRVADLVVPRQSDSKSKASLTEVSESYDPRGAATTAIMVDSDVSPYSYPAQVGPKVRKPGFAIESRRGEPFYLLVLEEGEVLDRHRLDLRVKLTTTTPGIGLTRLPLLLLTIPVDVVTMPLQAPIFLAIFANSLD